MNDITLEVSQQPTNSHPPPFQFIAVSDSPIQVEISSCIHTRYEWLCVEWYMWLESGTHTHTHTVAAAVLATKTNFFCLDHEPQTFNTRLLCTNSPFTLGIRTVPEPF